MKFYYSTATCSTIAHIAIAEAGLKVEPVEVSWRRKLNVEELAKVNPLGSVPALELSNGKKLTQNIAILEYISEQAPAAKLFPAHGTFERSQVMSWLSFASSDFQRLFGPILMANRLTSIEAAQREVKDYGLKSLEKYLEHINSSLEGKEYIVGNSYTAADIALFVLIGWCKWAEVKVSPYKNIMPYMKRIYQRPAVQKVLASEELLDYLPS